MAKKKKSKRIHDAGKSILHIKNSSGGFYKVRKAGRLGKNCVYYDERKLICILKGKWCKNASICSLFKNKESVRRNDDKLNCS